MMKENYKRGVTLYIALIVTGAILVIGVAVANVASRQVTLASISKDSQAAFFAADSGTECALYWDLKNTPASAFSTSSPSSPVYCNGKTMTFTPYIQYTSPTTHPYYGIGTSTISFDYSPTYPYCVIVTVTKYYSSGSLKTKIQSRGYNIGTASGGNCTSSSPRRVERGIEVNY